MIKQALLGLALCLALSGALAQADPWEADWEADTGEADWDGDFDAALDAVFDDPFQDPSDSARETDPEFELDEVLAVNLSAAGEAAALQLGFRVMQRLPLNSLGFSLTRLRLPDSFRPLKMLAALKKADPEGQYGANSIYRLAEAPEPGGACEGLRCYGQALIGWTPGCASSARLGMLDSAVDAGSPALSGRKLYTTRFSDTRASAREQDHGTAVAALLVGDPASGFAGVLPEAKLFAADVFSLDKQARPYTDAVRLAQGLNWLAQQKLDALNISITGPSSPVLHRAVQALDRRGVPMAAAAGNLGPEGPPQFPAAYPEVLAVTAVDRDLQVYAEANRGAYVRLAAPGVGIWSAGAGDAGRFRDGTSFATPYVTAALALAARTDPEKPAAAARIGRLLKTSRDLGERGSDAVFGSGLLQAPACTATRAAEAPAAAPPLPKASSGTPAAPAARRR